MVHKTFQWIPLVVEIGKQHSEKQIGLRAFYLNSIHDNSNKPSKETLTNQMKTIFSGIKNMVKSNLINTEVHSNHKTRR